MSAIAQISDANTAAIISATFAGIAVLLGALGSFLAAMNRGTMKRTEQHAREGKESARIASSEATRSAEQASEARQIITNRTPLFERMVAVDERLAASIELLAQKAQNGRDTK